jgi:hypothetical protein
MDSPANAGIVSLLIGVTVRGWLTDHEKELLDALVPSSCICFLHYDGHYLHPESVPMLSPEQLECSYLQDNAVYSHRQRLNSGRFSNSRVHAVRIGEFGGNQLTFGMIGSDHGELFDHAADNFSIITGRLRAAAHQVEPVTERLNRALRSEYPVLVVNRCSGRIMATNGATQGWYKESDRDLVGQEFNISKQHLSNLLATHSLHAENFWVEEINLSIVTLKPRQVKAQEVAEMMNPRFIDSLRRATQALHSTAHHLEGIINWQPGHPETELLRLIQEETTELEQVVHRYQLLTVFDHLRRESINPAEALRQTVTHAAIHHPNRQLSLTEQWAARSDIEVPAEALAVLYETILQIHLSTGNCATTTAISLDVDEARRLKIQIETSAGTAGAHLHHNADWDEYVVSLARLLGFTLEQRAEESSKIVTILMHHKD